MPGGLLSCFGFKKAQPSPAPTSVLGEAKRISQEAARAVDDDDDFALRMAGFDNDDPEIKAIQQEREKRRSQDMEEQAARRKAEEESFLRRLQRM